MKKKSSKLKAKIKKVIKVILSGLAILLTIFLIWWISFPIKTIVGEYKVIREFKKYKILDDKLFGKKYKDRFVRYPNTTMGKTSYDASVENVFEAPDGMTETEAKDFIIKKLKENNWSDIKTKKRKDRCFIYAKKDERTSFLAVISIKKYNKISIEVVEKG